MELGIIFAGLVGYGTFIALAIYAIRVWVKEKNKGEK
jgi:hypothetical protein